MVTFSTECDVPVPGIPGTGIFSFFWWYRNRYRNKLVMEKVSEPVSDKFGTGKSLGAGIRQIWYRKKVSVSVSFSILGTVTHWMAMMMGMMMRIMEKQQFCVWPSDDYDDDADDDADDVDDDEDAVPANHGLFAQVMANSHDNERGNRILNHCSVPHHLFGDVFP